MTISEPILGEVDPLGVARNVGSFHILVGEISHQKVDEFWLEVDPFGVARNVVNFVILVGEISRRNRST